MPGGIARYVRELLLAMARLDHESRFTVAYRLSRLMERRHFLAPPGPNWRTRLFQEPLLYTLGRADVFHGPDARVPRAKRSRLVATIHDLFSVVSGDFARDDFREKKIRRYEDLVKRCVLLLAVSEHTRRLSIERLGAEPDRVLVTPEGVSERFKPPEPHEVARVRHRYGIAGDYLLFVGELSRRKNLARAVEAFAGLERADSLSLVLAGRPSFGYEEIEREISRHRIEAQVLRPGFVTTEDLPALYGGAVAFVLPSLDEGFGLPMLEAMACCTPVIASNRGALPEVAGDAALLVEPESVDDLRNSLAALLEDATLRRDLVARGTARARAFTWERTARLTLDAYRLAAQ